jgi:hypothetical protein
MPALSIRTSSLFSLLTNARAADCTEGREVRSHCIKEIGGQLGTADSMSLMVSRALDSVRAER